MFEKNKNNKIKYGVLISILSLMVVIVFLSLVAPHGEDYIRKTMTATYGNTDFEMTSEGTYIQADSSGTDFFFKEDDSFSAEFTINQSGKYKLSACYLPLKGNGQELEYEIEIDGEQITDSSEVLTLTRVWTDSKEFRRTLSGDEIRPSQIENEDWVEESFRLNTKGEAVIELSEGKHSLVLKQKEGSCFFKFLRFYPENFNTYAEYSEKNRDYENTGNVFIKIEGECPSFRSSPEVNLSYDRSSPFSVPYHPTCIRFNTIGGDNWKKEGQWIEWQFEVPKSGLYKLGMRYRQNGNKGCDSLRSLRIDGEIPFEEASHLDFDYDVDWKSEYFGDGEIPYLIFLEEGKHSVRLEPTLGNKAELVEMMQASLLELNALYREIIMITGTDPDLFRDYYLEESIPDLSERIVKLTDDFSSYIGALEKQYGEGSYVTRILSQVVVQLKGFSDKPYTIAKRLSVFKTNISALAEWILEFEEQPLLIDYLYVASPDEAAPKADGSAFSKIGHEIKAFAGSFTHSYNEIASSGDSNIANINVWMGKGRDQANVIKRMIDAYFTPDTGIGVNITLVDGALVKASLAGQGPDVNIFTTRGEAMNLAFRGAIADVSGFEGFDSLKGDYMESAFTPYTYEEKVYAVPESQEFYMMYIRTDIFDELGLEIPKTWQDVMALLPILQSKSLAIGLPYTDGYATMGNGIGTINLFPTLLSQKDINLYEKTGNSIETNLLTNASYEAFKQWSDFYVQYSFDFYKDDFNRFRTGEMPIIISSYLLYNNLAEAAPEISGQWIMTEIPGTPDENGEINRATCASGTCSIVLEGSEDKEGAWEFVKWWNSAETQEMYAREIEAELSTLGRYTPANLKAFDNSLWKEDEKEILRKQWNNVIEIPEVPGGYYVSRNLDNALRQVFYNGENARDTYTYWMSSVNEELERKQSQFEARKESGE